MRKIRLDESGVAAVEFALVLPIFALLLVATVDLGNLLSTQFRLHNAAAAGANYALVRADDISPAGAPALATTIAGLVRDNGATAFADVAVTVNNGSTATAPTGGGMTSGGTASNAGLCYCPTRSGAAINWGAPLTCAAACAGGGFAGRHVAIVASRSHTPLFSGFGLVEGGVIRVVAMVQAG